MKLDIILIILLNFFFQFHKKINKIKKLITHWCYKRARNNNCELLLIFQNELFLNEKKIIIPEFLQLR
jgi:hypothetical protein